MNRTKIEWVKNPDGTQGYTWNPITGCLNHTPEGLCLGGMFPCYAYKLAHGRLRNRYLANLNLPDRWCMTWEATQHMADPFYPRLWEDRMWDLRPKGQYDKAWNRDNRRWGSEKGIFVCDMSDLFGIGIPEGWTNRVLEEIKIYSQHRFYLLTKQPQNLIKFSPFPDNCWVGVTATDSYDFINRIGLLASTGAKVKYMSFEPLLGWDDILKPLFQRYITMLDWVIIGAQTKPYKPPKIEWVQEIIDACVLAEIPYFLKNSLDKVVPKVFGGEGELNQEMPNGTT